MPVRFAPHVAEKTRLRAGEAGRGRDALSPFEIPWRGWRDIGYRLYMGFFSDRVTLIAAGGTFYLLLALFPAFAAFFAIFGFVVDPKSVSDHLAFIGRFLPRGATPFLQDQIVALASQNAASLSVSFLAGLLFSLWSANNGIKTLFEAMNIAYGERERRGFVRFNAIALFFTVGAMLTAVLFFFAVGVVPAILAVVGLSALAETLIAVLRWPFVFVLVVFGIALFYRYGPSRRLAKWRWIFPGAVLTAFVWLIASIAFSQYLQNFSNYNATYGSLGAVIGFMMWVWLLSTIFIVGAKLNAEAEHQTAEDTTWREDRPVGLRGARVADTLGRATSGGKAALQ